MQKTVAGHLLSICSVFDLDGVLVVTGTVTGSITVEVPRDRDGDGIQVDNILCKESVGIHVPCCNRCVLLHVYLSL